MIERLAGDMTPGKAALSFLGLVLLYCWIRKWQVSREISRLGCRAPMIRFKLPFAIDFIYNYNKANAERRDLEFWGNALKTAKGASKFTSPPTTAELDCGISDRTIFTTDPVNIKAVISSQFADYGKGKRFHDEWKEFIGDSVFGTDGQLWSQARQTLRPMFVRERIMGTEVYEKHVQKLIRLLGGVESDNGSKVVDVVPLFLRYTMDVATDYLLGEGTNSLDHPATRVVEAFQYVLSRQSDYFRMDEFSWVLSRKKFRQELRVMEDFIQPYIRKTLSLTSEELDRKISKRDSFLDSLAKSTRDARFIRDQLITILLAGRDTTASTLSFCFFELSRNPDVVAKLRSELESRLGSGADARRPTYTDVKEMAYLNAVVNETMRVYPVVPLNVRYSLHNTTLPRGGGPDGMSPIGVRGGTRILFSSILMQKRADLYDAPDSPNYFDPEKWLPERWVSGWQPRPWEFIPFHRGQRSCIGQEFANVEMAYTVTRILQTYDRVVAFPAKGKEKVEDPILRLEVTMFPDHDLSCLFLKEGEHA